MAHQDFADTYFPTSFPGPSHWLGGRVNVLGMRLAYLQFTQHEETMGIFAPRETEKELSGVENK